MRKNRRPVVRVGLQAFEFSRASQHEKDVLDRPIEDKLLTRGELAERWKYSTETVKRRERARILCPIRLDGASSATG
jgi:hypothetical protein